jgi:glycosyltransferase involved in cell wall biosynthesis
MVFSRFDVLVVPSLWYDFPLVIYEAFASQTPVIASNLGGMAEAIEHAVNGLLFEPESSEDLADQIKQFLLQPQLLKNLIDGSLVVKTVDQEAMELENVYQYLIDQYQNNKSRSTLS